MPSRRSFRRWRRKSVPAIVALLVLSCVALLAAALVGLSLPGLKRDLDGARTALTSAQTALGRADLDGARRQLAVARDNARDAQRSTNGPLWKVVARAPFVGDSLSEIRAIAKALDATTTDVLPRLIENDLRPQRWQGRLDTTPLIRAREPVRQADEAMAATRRELDRAPDSGVGQVRTARVDLTGALRRLATTLTEVRVATQVLPTLAGAERPQRFFLAIQNNAEPRATGGLVGAYGILRTDKGRVVLERIGSNADLKDPPRPAIDLGEEYDARYGRFQTTRGWRSANLSSDTPTVGRLLAALWQAQTGERLDGVVLLDPVGLGLLLGATGPVVLGDGTRLTSANAVKTLLSDAYRTFPREQDAARNDYLQQAGRRVIGRLTTSGIDGTRLAQRVGAAATSGHLQVWAADPPTQALIAQSRVGGALPGAGPFLEVITQDVGGSKLGYYLRRAVSYVAAPTQEEVDLGAGPEAEEDATITVRLTNTAPGAGLPEYVTLRPDDPRAPVGQAKNYVSVVLGPRSTLLSASLDGRPVPMETATDRGMSVLSTTLTLDAGEARVLVLRVRQPATEDEPLRYRQQPLVVPDELVVRRTGSDRPVELVYGRPPR